MELLISFSQIKIVTNNFDENNLIRVDSFGKVYKGVLSNGVEVAVKRASSRSQLGFPEFLTEIKFLSNIRHRHLVSFIGYCNEGSEMILVFEYMEKGLLRNYLYGNELPSLSWKQRLEICIEAAKGLHFLHTGYSQTIIHGDVNSTNILLGEGYSAKVADFGFSKLVPSTVETHLSTVVKGTFGYLDPEYFKRRKITHKSDVYSFGVVLFEVLCARPVIDTSLAEEEISLAEWALMSLSRDQLEKIIDPRLVGEINENSLKKFGEIASKCLHEYGRDRPSIEDALWNLEYCLHLQETEVRRQPYEGSVISEAHFPVIPFVRRIPSSVVSHGAAATSGYRIDENNEGIKLDSASSAAGRKLKKIAGRFISFAQIKIATDNFDENNLIGVGGFGKVYKGVLSSGIEVVVKRASSRCKSSFESEIFILSEICHRHLVSLIGYCDECSEMIVVYEYMEKGSLRNYLYGNELPSLSWKKRLEICIDAAKGLHYLHSGYSQTVIHRDIKPSNILLGEGYLAKLSDFGLTMLGPSIGEMYVSTAVKGTFGYLDPEYFKYQRITEKSDVYSFGVMLLEVLCARHVIDTSLAEEEVNLAEWALMWKRRDQLEKLIDPRLVGEINENSLKKFGEIAEKCLQEYGMDRPAIGDVLWYLEYCLHLQETEVRRNPYEDSGTSEAQFPASPFVRWIPSSVVSHGTAATSGDSSYDNNEGIKLDSSSSAAGRKLKHIVVSNKKQLQKRTSDVKDTHPLWSPMTGVVNLIDNSSKSGGATTIGASPIVEQGLLIALAQIKIATNNFDENNLIGAGGFGKVYKGVLSNGVEVAVKRASSRSQLCFPEFLTEIEFLSKIRHRHLVSLIEYCNEGSEIILVFEYMKKGPLRIYLYGSASLSLSWKQRLEICIKAAKGLHYLHTGYSQTIIHRDVKSTNILLGEGYSAKVSDFGVSMLGASTAETHFSTAVKDTFGYLDPEYFKTQKLTDKSDVYSFGVNLLEVLCARPVIDTSLAREEINLAEWALMSLSRGQLEKIIDPKLDGEINENSLRKFGEIAEKCLQEYGMDRPAIGDVLWDLEYCLCLQETEVRHELFEDRDTSEGHFPLIPFVRRIPSSVVSHGTAATSGDSRVENNEGIELDSSSSAAGRKLKLIDGRI